MEENDEEIEDVCDNVMFPEELDDTVLLDVSVLLNHEIVGKLEKDMLEDCVKHAVLLNRSEGEFVDDGLELILISALLEEEGNCVVV